MAITNYWFQILWLFTGGYFLQWFYPKKREEVLGRETKRWRILPAVLLVVPYIGAAAWRTDRFGDTWTYRKTFQNAPDTLQELPKYLETISKDQGFAVLMTGCKVLFGNSDHLFFLLLAAFQMLVLALLYRKYSCDYWMSLFLFVAGTDYMSWCQNGIRQFLAVTILMTGFPFLLKKKYLPVLVLTLLASTMHASALFMIPVMFLVQGKAGNKKSILCMLLCLCLFFFASEFTGILDGMLEDTQYSHMVSDWQMWEDDGMNPVRVLIVSIPMLLAILGRRQIQKEADPCLQICVNFSVLTSATAILAMGTSGIFLGRMMAYSSVYSNSLLLPWEIHHLFTPSSEKLMTLALLCGYIVFFYYQMHVAWGIL